MTNHGFYVVLSSTAFQTTSKELKMEKPPISQMSICCLNYAFSGLILQWQETVWTRPVPEQVTQCSNKARVWYYRSKISKLLLHPVGFRKVDTECVFQQCWINVFRRGGNSGYDSAHGSLWAKAPSPSMPEPVCFLDKSGFAGRRKMLN